MAHSFQERKAPFDIDALLNPSKAFRLPLDVVGDPDLTVSENARYWRRGRPTHTRSIQIRH